MQTWDTPLLTGDLEHVSLFIIVPRISSIPSVMLDDLWLFGRFGFNIIQIMKLVKGFGGPGISLSWQHPLRTVFFPALTRISSFYMVWSLLFLLLMKGLKSLNRQKSKRWVYFLSFTLFSLYLACMDCVSECTNTTFFMITARVLWGKLWGFDTLIFFIDYFSHRTFQAIWAPTGSNSELSSQSFYIVFTVIVWDIEVTNPRILKENVKWFHKEDWSCVVYRKDNGFMVLVFSV